MSKVEREHHATKKEYLRRCTIGEVCERDWEWLRTGKTPEITFETPELEAEIKKKRLHEIRTAERLVSQGVRADFVVDERKIFDKGSGLWQSVGRPDFKSGIEIKTLLSSSAYNTIDWCIRNASKKRETKILIIDNTENNSLPDDKLAAYISKSQRFKRGKIYMVDSTEKLVLIR